VKSWRFLTRRVAIAVAIALAAGPAWGHTFPPVRTVVVQVEPCELAVLVGFKPSTGEPIEAILARSANSTKSRGLESLRDVMTAYAVAPLTIAIDGKPLVPTKVRAKLGVEGDGSRPIVVALVTYALPSAGTLSIKTKDARTTRISWQDRASGRVELGSAPEQDRWHAGVASFLLNVGAGAPACARTFSPSSR
jgi:hypothetical protein